MTQSTKTPRIVVGVDGSACSADALRWALEIAEPMGATVDAIIAWDFPTMYGLAYVPTAYEPDRDALKELTETVDAVVGPERPAGMRLVAVQGSPARVLLDRSAEATMLVVGSRGHGGFVGLLIGSVSAYCAEHATCPVLVVHGGTESGATESRATELVAAETGDGGS